MRIVRFTAAAGDRAKVATLTALQCATRRYRRLIAGVGDTA